MFQMLSRRDLMFQMRPRVNLMFKMLPRRDLKFQMRPRVDLMFKMFSRRDLMFQMLPRVDLMFNIFHTQICNSSGFGLKMPTEGIVGQKATLCIQPLK